MSPCRYFNSLTPETLKEKMGVPKMRWRLARTLNVQTRHETRMDCRIHKWCTTLQLSLYLALVPHLLS